MLAESGWRFFVFYIATPDGSVFHHDVTGVKRFLEYCMAHTGGKTGMLLDMTFLCASEKFILAAENLHVRQYYAYVLYIT